MPAVKCQRCQGSGMLEAKIKNLGTLDYELHVISCDDCSGKGFRGDETGRVYASVVYPSERPYGNFEGN